MTGLIYVAIIAVWAVVLVPAWLRRHDHLDPERSVDRFSRSMQTLAHRPSVLGIPLPDQDAEDVDDVVPEVLRVTRPDLSSAAALAGRLAGRAGMTGQGRADAPGGARRRLGAPARRRIVLGVLTAALLVVGALVGLGILVPAALAAPAVLLVAFLGVARHQVRSARRRRSSRTGRTAPAASEPAPARSGASRVGGETWEARSTPLPTYVTAPPASGFPRVIDTETPGAWTAAAMLERAQQEKVRAERMAQAKAEAIARAKAEQAAAEARSRDEEYLDAQATQWLPRPSSLHRRRAVNE